MRDTQEIIQKLLSMEMFGDDIYKHAVRLTGDADGPGPNLFSVRDELEGWVTEIVKTCLPSLAAVPDLVGKDRIDNLVKIGKSTCEAICGLDGIAAKEQALAVEIATLCPGDVTEGVREILHDLSHEVLVPAWLLRDGLDPALANVRPEEEEALCIAQMKEVFGDDVQIFTLG